MHELVEKRTRSSKTYSLGERKFSLDATIGAVHYEKDGQWEEIDAELVPAVAPWDWEMTKAGYRVRVKEDFTAGQVVEFSKAGESVTLQPMALEWTNDLDQIQPIVMPSSVAALVTNPEVDLLLGVPSHTGTIRWNGAYGPGLDFQWQTTPTRLRKILEIDSLSSLPVPEQYVLDGGNPVLRLNLIFDPSSGVDIYVDGGKWNKRDKKQTFDTIQFRKDGEVLWGFMPLRYWGSSEDDDGQSIATVEKRGSSLYISIRVPYSWLQTATFPVFIDVDVDERVAASADDANERDSDGTSDITSTTIKIHTDTTANQRFWGGFRWELSIAQSVSVGVAYIELWQLTPGDDDAAFDIYLEDAAAPSAFTTTNYDLSDRTRTTASVAWDEDNTATGQYIQSPSLVGPVQEVIDAFSITSLVAICRPRNATDKALTVRSWDGWEPQAAQIHIEYTANGAPTPAAVGGGAVTIVGLLTRVFRQVIAVGAANLGIAGTLTAVLTKFAAMGGGAVTIVGTLTKVFKQFIAVGGASISIAGALARMIAKSFGGASMSIASVLARKTLRQMGEGSVTIAGTLARVVTQALQYIAVGGATMTIVGSLVAISEWIALTLKRRVLSFTVKPREVSLTLKRRSLSFTLKRRIEP